MTGLSSITKKVDQNQVSKNTQNNFKLIFKLSKYCKYFKTLSCSIEQGKKRNFTYLKYKPSNQYGNKTNETSLEKTFQTKSEDMNIIQHFKKKRKSQKY